MTIHDLDDYLKTHWAAIKEQLLDGSYPIGYGLTYRTETIELNFAMCFLEDMRMVSGLTRNQLPGDRLRVRIPCPPL